MTVSTQTLTQLHNQRKTSIADYNALWPAMFLQEADRLKSVFKDAALEIHHIGSTAVPEMKSKPIIDILITVHDIQRVDTLDQPMKHLGYACGKEFGIPGRRFFCKGDANHCHVHVHVYEETHPAISQYIHFRDYMIAHPDKAQEYESLKSTLAQKYPHNRTLYTEGKTEFIDRINQKTTSTKNEGIFSTTGTSLQP